MILSNEFKAREAARRETAFMSRPLDVRCDYFDTYYFFSAGNSNRFEKFQIKNTHHTRGPAVIFHVWHLTLKKM